MNLWIPVTDKSRLEELTSSSYYFHKKDGSKQLWEWDDVNGWTLTKTIKK